MSIRESHAPGTPSWVDLSSPDVEASAAFYGELFGWRHESAGPVEETGGYGMFSLDGRQVAGIGPKQDPNMPTVWTTYVTTTDVEASVARIEAGGGTVLMPALAVMDAGSMAIAADPTGAIFALWQPGRHIGAELVNAPGALVWNELAVKEPGPLPAFYGDVFGWTTNRVADMPGGRSYDEWQLDGHTIGGLSAMGDEMPPGLPTHWAVYFGVADTDAAVEQATALGATLLFPAVDIPIGRFAFLNDPQGASFAVIALNEWPA